MTRKQAGFSLVELMVVIAVLAIIAAVALPSFQGMRDAARVRSAVEAVYSQLQFARSESVKQNRDLFVSVTTGASWCVGISNVTGCACGTPGSCQFGPAGALAENNVLAENFVGVSLASNLTEFLIDNRRGGTAAAATLTLTGGSSKTGSVTISPLGRVSICGNAGGYPSC